MEGVKEILRNHDHDRTDHRRYATQHSGCAALRRDRLTTKDNNAIPQHATRGLSAHRRFRHEVLQYSTTSKTEGPVGAGRYRSLLGRVAGPSDYSVEAMVCYARHAYGTSHHYGGERAMDGVVCLRRSREQGPVSGNSGKMRIPRGTDQTSSSTAA